MLQTIHDQRLRGSLGGLSHRTQLTLSDSHPNNGNVV